MEGQWLENRRAGGFFLPLAQKGRGIMGKLKKILIGDDRDPKDPAIFHKVSLVAFFAWIGLGADGISSSCYGPEETFRVLIAHPPLALIVAIASALTIFIISASYKQIVEVFPTGGGGYVVASKLLSPTLGMISGCALLVDYVLTISISVSSGMDAIFSFFPSSFLQFKIGMILFGIVLLIFMNMRGVKESVVPLVPIFLIFIATHAFAFIYTFIVHAMDLPRVLSETSAGLNTVSSEIGWLGAFALIMKAYSMGAGTYTGIEAVSNGLPILRDPKVQTAKKTMLYMSISLAATVVGLMIGYILYKVVPTPDMSKTLNAIYFDAMTANWNPQAGHAYVWITLVSEATLLFVAAQTGFLDGPRVLANMALDQWFPTRFAMLSNRLVTQNGIMSMGVAAFITVLVSHGDVRILVILYSINVFLTFALSQLGMVRHWWMMKNKAAQWKKSLMINGIGLSLTFFILASVIVLKFDEGGWVTILVTGMLVGSVLMIKRHYARTGKILQKLNTLVSVVSEEISRFSDSGKVTTTQSQYDSGAKTAVVLVSGFNGIGIHTLMSIIQLFPNVFKNFVFVQIGIVDAGNFKGAEEISLLNSHVSSEVLRYVEYMRFHGFYAEAYTAIGNDVIHEVVQLMPRIKERFSNVVLFGGQLVFPEESFLTKWLHNYITFALQRKFYHEGTPFIIMPIRV
jgi:amino acid transporter